MNVNITFKFEWEFKADGSDKKYKTVRWFVSLILKDQHVFFIRKNLCPGDIISWSKARESYNVIEMDTKKESLNIDS